jgi:NhaP-type Na+/H+ or K+/H+ antiporter
MEVGRVPTTGAGSRIDTPIQGLESQAVQTAPVEHGVGLEAVVVVAAGAVLWGLVGGRLERGDITAPIAFIALGLLAANEPLQLLDISPSSETVRAVAELTLALVLFSDASSVDLGALRRDTGVPARLLFLGLPLTIALGCGVALLVLPGVDGWLALLIAASVAPTDAALGAPIMENRRIPARVRRVLNVESGLNDGIATPVVAFAIAGAAVATHTADAVSLKTAVADLALGALTGGASGFAGGWLLRRTARLGWASSSFRPIAVLGVALFAYAVAVNADANGFVAAFVGGMAFGSVMDKGEQEALELTTNAGGVGSIVVWFIFGAFLIPVLEHSSWSAVVYAVVSLTVVRMVPVALALLGTGLDRATVLVLGWFGPRGLASVVFALIALDGLDGKDGRMVLGVISVVVLMSVIAHGVSARPVGSWYTRRNSREGAG